MRTSNFSIRKYLFFSALLSISIGIIFYSAKLVFMIHFQSQSAISAVKDTGIYIQQIAGVSKRLQSAKNSRFYGEHQRKMIALIRNLELSRLSISKLNPASGFEFNFTTEVRQEYHATLKSRFEQIDQIITRAKTLSAIPFKKLNTEDPAFLYLQAVSKGLLISTISAIIQDYRLFAEDKISRIVFLSFASLFVVFLAFIFGYGFFFRTTPQRETLAIKSSVNESVATVLGGLTVFPGKAEGGMELIRE